MAGCTWVQGRRGAAASSTAVRFSVLEHLKQLACSTCGYDSKAILVVTFLAGGTAGAVSAVANNPIDVVKSRVQSGAATKIEPKDPLARAASGHSEPDCRRDVRLFLSQASNSLLSTGC